MTGTAITKHESTGLEKIKAYAEMDDVKKRFMNLLGDRDGRVYVESVIIAVANSESLQECSPKSIMIQAMRAASMKLSLDPIMEQAYLVAYKGQANLIPDYRGLVQLSVNTNYYEVAPNVDKVYEGETVELDRLSGRISFGGKRTSDKEIGWFAYFKAKNGTERWLYMTNAECDEHGKKYNPGGFSSSKSAWATDREKMRRKTVLRIFIKRWGNFSQQVAQLIDESNVIDADVEFPSDENIIVPEEKKRTQGEMLKELGYEVKADEPKQDTGNTESAIKITKPGPSDEADEWIDPNEDRAVAFAARAWGVSIEKATEQIGKSKKFYTPMSKIEFKELVKGER